MTKRQCFPAKNREAVPYGKTLIQGFRHRSDATIARPRQHTRLSIGKATLRERGFSVKSQFSISHADFASLSFHLNTTAAYRQSIRLMN